MVSRSLYAGTLHLTYQTLTFSAHSEWALNVLNIKPFVEARSEPKRLEKHLEHVQDLRFIAPFRVARFQRCSYRTAFWYDQHITGKQKTDQNMFHADFLCEILNQIRMIFDELKIQSLRSFRSVSFRNRVYVAALIQLRWHMGICLPAHILDEDGYLTLCQRNIQHISLRIDASCPHTGLRLGGLVSMSSLRSLSWECIGTVEEVGLLQRCVEQNVNHLQTLELVFGLPNISGEAFIATIGRLSNLQTLSLARFHFDWETHSALYLVLPHLKSLTLRDCPGQLAVLGALSLLDIPLRLRCFEISFDGAYGSENYDGSHPLIDFLTSFGTLVQLHMLASNTLSPEQHLRIIESHPVLKQFVYHTRHLLSADQVLPEETQYIPVPLFQPVRNVLYQSSIRNLGLCIYPFSAVSIVLHSIRTG
jgi:hypothetical protein